MTDSACLEVSDFVFLHGLRRVWVNIPVWMRARGLPLRSSPAIRGLALHLLWNLRITRIENFDGRMGI
jgi:hypothetical protein